MKAPRTFSSPEPFKQALEQRLRSSSMNGVDFARRRQLLVFDRFLARIAATMGDAATLKGGLVLELRVERATSMGVEAVFGQERTDAFLSRDTGRLADR